MKSFDLGGWTNPQPLGVFSVKRGEVIYIGNLVFARSDMTLTMGVEDKFDEFKSTLPPALAMKIQKRLIELPASVTFDTVTYTRISN